MRRVFVISDLHLGGRPDRTDESGRLVTGFQICNAYKELVTFIDWLSHLERPANEEFELVLNGDIVDFLADDDYVDSLHAQLWTADEAQVISKLNRIVERTRENRERGVFEALRDFHSLGNRLTLLIGNHDVELSLPAVRQHLLSLLGDDSGLLKFVYDGEAYTIGKVLIEHGNRYDPWNMIDHSALRQERSMRSRNLPIGEEDREERYFIPPAGTHLVIQFMNFIKSSYRFVDLLKPETNAVIPILIALEPERWFELERIVKAGSIMAKVVSNINRYFLGSMETSVMPEVPGNMGLPGETLATGFSHEDSLDMIVRRSVESLSLRNVLQETLGDDARLFPPPQAENKSVDEIGAMGLPGGITNNDDLGNLGMAQWLKDTGRALKKRLEPITPGRLSAATYFRQAGEKISEFRYQQLHAALRSLNRDDRSFDPAHELDQYKSAARDTALKGDFEAIVYGHTHLPKKVRLSESPKNRWYLNTGTWADVIRLPQTLAGDYASAGDELKNFVAALKQNDFSRYIYRYLSFVELVVDVENHGQVRSAELYSFGGTGRERSAPLTNILRQ